MESLSTPFLPSLLHCVFKFGAGFQLFEFCQPPENQVLVFGPVYASTFHPLFGKFDLPTFDANSASSTVYQGLIRLDNFHRFFDSLGIPDPHSTCFSSSAMNPLISQLTLQMWLTLEVSGRQTLAKIIETCITMTSFPLNNPQVALLMVFESGIQFHLKQRQLGSSPYPSALVLDWLISVPDGTQASCLGKVSTTIFIPHATTTLSD